MEVEPVASSSGKKHKPLRQIAFAAIVVALVLCLTEAACYLFFTVNPKVSGIAFPPGTTSLQRTEEFTFTTRINDLGFRDDRAQADRTAKVNIVTIGDSFTFGTGVDIDRTWSKKLEGLLRSAGDDVRVHNLGKIGANPRDYSHIVRRALRPLRPALVIVAIGQGEDLAQLRFHAPLLHPHAFVVHKSPYLRPLKNTVSWLHHFQWKPKNTPESFTAHWSSHAIHFVKNMTGEERARYERLPKKVRKMFLTGQLGPTMVISGLADPGKFSDTLDPDDPKVRPLVEEMTAKLEIIRRDTDRHDATVLVVAVPKRIFVDEHGNQVMRIFGYNTNEGMLTSHKMDESIQRAANKAGLPFASVTDHFRSISGAHPLYFEFDGHFNEAGHARFAQAILPFVKRSLTQRLDR